MNSLILLLILSFRSVLLLESNSKRVQKRWASTNWPSMRDRLVNIEQDFRRRTDSMNQWMQERHQIPSFAPILGLTESFEDLTPQQFDPSVVVVDKGIEKENNKPFDTDMSFPFGISFDRPKFWSFGDIFQTYKPWWKGPNVCTERQVIDSSEAFNTSKNSGLEVEDSISSVRYQSNLESLQHSISLQSTHCTESDTSYTCITKIIRGRENKTTTVKHQCCHGFKRVKNNYCTQVDLKDLIQTMKDLKSNRMLRMIERIGFSEKLSAQNITVFALTDDSLIEYEDDHNKLQNEIETSGQPIQLMPSVVRKRRQSYVNMKEVIAMHLIPGLLRTGDFDDEQIIQTMSPNNKTIRINIYNNPKRVVTANCAPIISANNYATNGIVHILDRVMPSPIKTLADIIEDDQRFTILKTLLTKTGLINELRDSERPKTLLAPTNEAFLKLEELYLERLLNGQSCVESLILNHIINSTLCSTAVKDYASVRNALNVMLPIKRVEEKLEINGIRVTETDVLATNGLIHVIDGVMLSQRSQPISRFLEKHRMTQYLDLIKESGLLNEWDAMNNISFFIPSIDSMRSLPQKRLEDIKNNTKEIIGFHVIKPKTNALNWNNDQLLDTIQGNQVRVNIFGDIPGFGFRTVRTAQCAKIVDESDICGANIHIVDRFIAPTKGNLVQTLDSMEKFSILRKIIKNSQIEEELEKGVYTLLAVTDQTFESQFSQNQINSLTTNRSESEKFIRSYLLPEVMCCSGVNSSPLLLGTQKIRTLEGSLVSAHKSFSGRVRFGSARVTQCDIMADNGVIHVINRVLENDPIFMPSLPFSFEFII